MTSASGSPYARAARLALGIALLSLLVACNSVGRNISNTLPSWLRPDPGGEETEIYRQLIAAREPEAADLEEQDRRFAEIEARLAEEKWEEAGDLCEDYIEEYATSRYDERVRYELGRARMLDDEYRSAYSAFRTFTDVYVVSDYYPDIMERSYQIGKAYITGERTGFLGIFSYETRGEEILNFVIERFPSGPRAPDAQWLVARWLEVDGSHERAWFAYRFLAKNWPDAPQAEEAAFRAAENARRLVKGVAYDSERMVIARESYQKYLEDYPDGMHAAEAARARDEIFAQEARKTLEVGRWYLNRGKAYGSRYFFQRVRVLYPGTPAAAEAAQLLKETQAAGSEIPEAPPLVPPAAAPVAPPAPEPPPTPEPAEGEAGSEEGAEPPGPPAEGGGS
jgi:outer membrane protein assembly factor BamD (BamD/ComL family)